MAVEKELVGEVTRLSTSECADVIRYLRGIEPVDKTSEWGGDETCGYLEVLRELENSLRR